MGSSEDFLEIAKRILYCDSNCVVVNKIAGEAVEGAVKGMADLPGQLAAALLADEHLPVPPAEDPLAVPVAAHRLDVPVSGCVLFARTRAALRFFNAAFSSAAAFNGKDVEKRYWAVVELPQKGALLYDISAGDSTFGGIADGHVGDHVSDHVSDHVGGELIHWIQFDPRRNKSAAFDEPGPGRKKAILRYRLAGRGCDYLFLEIEPVTGRHHQIRAQLERVGLHVKGDLKYGARRSEKNGGIRLHARSLSFPEPFAGSKRITVQADPPLRDNLWLAFIAI